MPGCKPAELRMASRFLARRQYIQISAQRHVHTLNPVGDRVLLCGDGDLSYGASISKKLQEKGTSLTVSVLESRDHHRSVYRDSDKNADIIQSHGHSLRFETDATRLKDYPELDAPFDRIQFNFPHWRGKTNIRHNRQLLSDFFASTINVLRSSGQVHVALMDHQGGSTASTLKDWKQSWMAAHYAAQQNLLLVDVQPFQANYNLSAYRWQDRRFRIKGEPQLYIFCAPDSPACHAPVSMQLYCYFRILLRHDRDDGTDIPPSSSKITSQVESLSSYVKDRIPKGWRTQVEFLDLVDGRNMMQDPENCWWAAYGILFCGQDRPLTRDEAEESRLLLVDEMVADGMSIRQRSNWVISNPCPCRLLHHYIKTS